MLSIFWTVSRAQLNNSRSFLLFLTYLQVPSRRVTVRSAPEVPGMHSDEPTREIPVGLGGGALPGAEPTAQPEQAGGGASAGRSIPVTMGGGVGGSGGGNKGGAQH